MRKFLLYILALAVLPQIAEAVASFARDVDPVALAPDVPAADSAVPLPLPDSLAPVFDLSPSGDTFAALPDSALPLADSLTFVESAPVDTFVP